MEKLKELLAKVKEFVLMIVGQVSLVAMLIWHKIKELLAKLKEWFKV